MKVNKNYEAELNLKDLLFHILYKWRIILLIGIIVAGIFGVVEYWGFEKYHRNGEKAPVEIQYESDLDSYQKSLDRVNALVNMNKTTRNGNNAGVVSILLGIDPTNIWTAEKKYFVDVEPSSNETNAMQAEGNSALKILAILAEAFSDEIDGEKLNEVFGTSIRRDINEVASICIDPDLKTLSVIGCGATEEQAVKRKEFVDTYLQTANKELSKTEKYKLILLGDSVGSKLVLTTRDQKGEKIEKDLWSMQWEMNTNYMNYQNQVYSYTVTRNDLAANPPAKPVPKTLRQALFGFAIGVFLAIAVCIMSYLFNGRLKTGRELKYRYDLSLLGEFTHSRGWWKGKGFDWILEKLEFGRKTNFENEMDNIASLVDGDKDGRSILLTSSLEEKEVKKIYDGLASRLQEKGIDLVLLPDYLYSSEAVCASGKTDAVLLVEEKYKSRVRDLNRMADMMTIKEAKVIGAVLI